jgi:indole-3-glycerol phosphate synthase
MLEAKRIVCSFDPRPLVLRKDFIVDEYQLFEAVAFGADTVLLIVAILTDLQLQGLIQACRKLGMEPLVEAANPEETSRAIKAGVGYSCCNRFINTWYISQISNFYTKF